MNMTDEDYYTLERLLDKMRSDISHPFAIACSINEMYHIGIYDGNGNLIKETITPTIRETVNKLKSNER